MTRDLTGERAPMSGTSVVREYGPHDTSALRALVSELQDFERRIEPRLRPGAAMAESYMAGLHRRCRDSKGQVFVADVSGTVVGFVCVLAREVFTELDDPVGSCAVVTDLVVLPSYRRQGIGRSLLDRAETYARAAGARELRIGVLARNVDARRLYLDAAFEPYHETFAKPL
jgi:GNAT superfamily N-acetyltransferase